MAVINDNGLEESRDTAATYIIPSRQSLLLPAPLFLPERHYKNVLSALDAYFKAAITARPPPKRKTESEKEQPKKNGARERGKRGKSKREGERERDKEVIG